MLMFSPVTWIELGSGISRQSRMVYARMTGNTLLLTELQSQLEHAPFWVMVQSRLGFTPSRCAAYDASERQRHLCSIKKAEEEACRRAACRYMDKAALEKAVLQAETPAPPTPAPANTSRTPPPANNPTTPPETKSDQAQTATKKAEVPNKPAAKPHSVTSQSAKAAPTLAAEGAGVPISQPAVVVNSTEVTNTSQLAPAVAAAAAAAGGQADLQRQAVPATEPVKPASEPVAHVTLGGNQYKAAKPKGRKIRKLFSMC